MLRMGIDVPLAVSKECWLRRPKGRAQGYTEKRLGWCVYDEDLQKHLCF